MLLSVLVSLASASESLSLRVLVSLASHSSLALLAFKTLADLASPGFTNFAFFFDFLSSDLLVGLSSDFLSFFFLTFE
jgi:hypothetical protein